MVFLVVWLVVWMVAWLVVWLVVMVVFGSQPPVPPRRRCLEYRNCSAAELGSAAAYSTGLAAAAAAGMGIGVGAGMGAVAGAGAANPDAGTRKCRKDHRVGCFAGRLPGGSPRIAASVAD